jgi:uncharacterized membrane protein
MAAKLERWAWRILIGLVFIALAIVEMYVGG